MTEALHGRDGLITALASPEDWEARAASANWSHYTIWRTWDLRFLEDNKCEFRRIEKPREAMQCECNATLTNWDGSGARLNIALTSWTPGTQVRVTIREIVPNAPPDPDWKREYERERAAHEKTKKRTETAEAKLSELSAAAGSMCDSFGDALGKLLESLKRCAPEGETDG